MGKTHLMHAIAWDTKRRNPDAKVLYLSAEQFMYRFVQALRFKDTMSFKELFRSVDLLMVDDVQFIAGKDSTQDEFFHTFNALVDQNKQIVISADRAPGEIDGLAVDVKSFDPALALDGGADGMACWAQLLPRLAAVLAVDGMAFVEIGHGQENAVTAVAEKVNLQLCDSHCDLAGITRCLAFSIKM